MDKLILILVFVVCAGAAMAARSVTIDPSFAYYKDRSPGSIVEEIRANGYGDIRVVGVHDELVKAFRDAGVTVWFLTFMNGTYSTAELPKGWEAWQMKLRKTGKPDGFTYLCCNNPDYRQWKQQQITAALKACAYDGIDLIEPYFPAYPGPQSDIYGCLCDHCVAVFKKMYPEVTGLPDFEDEKSANYWKTDKTLYEKWVGFRVSSVVNYLDELVNGKEGIREKCPKVRVATWSLGIDVPDQITKLREWEGLDAAAIVKRIKPDMHVIQTDWPDWSKPDLSSKYPLKYKAIVDSIREVAPSLPLMMQADIGSRANMRRSRQWLEEVEKRAKEIGCESTTSYEYSLGDYIYTEPPAVLKAESEPGGVKLTFNKRVDSVSASNMGNYSVNTGRVDYAKVDGNIVHLTVSGAEEKIEVSMSGITDDEPRRLYHDKPACALTEGARVKVE